MPGAIWWSYSHPWVSCVTLSALLPRVARRNITSFFPYCGRSHSCIPKALYWWRKAAEDNGDANALEKSKAMEMSIQNYCHGCLRTAIGSPRAPGIEQCPNKLQRWEPGLLLGILRLPIFVSCLFWFTSFHVRWKGAIVAKQHFTVGRIASEITGSVATKLTVSIPKISLKSSLTLKDSTKPSGELFHQRSTKPVDGSSLKLWPKQLEKLGLRPAKLNPNAQECQGKAQNLLDLGVSSRICALCSFYMCQL